MKLGEALSLRARQAQMMDDLRGRIRANALVQEGEEPAEDANALIEEFVTLSDEHGRLVERIARTNAALDLGGGQTMLSLLHEREALRRARNIHEAAAQAGTPNSQNIYRYRATELRMVSQVNVQALRQRAQEIDDVIRNMDAVIQTANWENDLVEE